MIKLLPLNNKLPFYSQLMVLRYKDDETGSKFLIKSFDPLLTLDDIKGIYKKDGYDNIVEFKKSIKHSYFIDTSASGDCNEGDKENKKAPRVKIKKGVRLSQYLSDALIEHRSHYKRPDLLQKMVDEYMSKYDLEQEIEKRLREHKVVDEEGFELVTTGPKPKLTANLNKKKKTKASNNKNLTDFYKFQLKQN